MSDDVDSLSWYALRGRYEQARRDAKAAKQAARKLQAEVHRLERENADLRFKLREDGK